MSNTIVTPGVVLSRRPHGEFDLLAVIYTEDLGKVHARFKGVRKPKAKLKALAEPMVHAEYRLYVRPGTEWATATGGRIVESYPALREDFAKTCQGLRLCELLSRLVASHSPNPRKYALITQFLSAIERHDSPWLDLAFGLRLLELAGYGLHAATPEGIDPHLWASLHAGSVEALAERPDEEPARRSLDATIERTIHELIDRPLSTSLFQDSLRAFSTGAAA